MAGGFRVALSFITKLLKQYRETGEIGPKPNKGGVKLKLNAEQLAILGELIEENNDATTEELCQLMMEKTGVKVSLSTMSRITKKLNFTVKKKLCMQEKKAVKEYKI